MGRSFKCTDSLPFLPLLAFHRFLDFTQNHFGDAAGGSTQNGQGFMGIKIYHMREIICHKMLMRIETAPLHRNESDAVFYGGSEPDLQVQIIQLFQKAACGHKLQITKII